MAGVDQQLLGELKASGPAALSTGDYSGIEYKDPTGIPFLHPSNEPVQYEPVDSIEVEIPERYYAWKTENKEIIPTMELEPIDMKKPGRRKVNLVRKNTHVAVLKRKSTPTAGSSPSASSPTAPTMEQRPGSVQNFANRMKGKIGAAGKSVADKFAKQFERLHKIFVGQHEVEPTVSDSLLESLNYDAIEDYVTEQALANDPRFEKHQLVMLALRGFYTILVGFITAMIGFFLSHSLDFFNDGKFEGTMEAIEEGRPFIGWLKMIGTCVGFTTVASWLCCTIAPEARGSGVPYVLGYINGSNMGGFFHWRTVVIKVLALLFTIAGGLTLGMEGPFIFIGGGVAMICALHLPTLAASLESLTDRILSWGKKPPTPPPSAASSSSLPAAAAPPALYHHPSTVGGGGESESKMGRASMIAAENRRNAGGSAAAGAAAGEEPYGLGVKKDDKYLKVMHNIQEERVLVAGGVAAGLAVAFNAPIAGVLFAVEGCTAFLNVPVVLRIFATAMFAIFFSDLGHSNFSPDIKRHNLIVITKSVIPQSYSWVIYELFFFVAIGVVGGVIGAGATWLNIKMSKWRHHHIEDKKWKKMLEILLFTILIASTWFTLPFIFGCRPEHEQCIPRPEDAVAKRCVQLFCEEGYYSDLGTIVFGTSDQIARIIFDRSVPVENDFRTGPLIVYGFLYWVFVSLIYGSYVPGGLFVPSVVVGGVYGRVMGIWLSTWLGARINPGVYAMLGAGGMLGGFTRLALPVCIMLVEMTGDATYLLPVMITTVIAKLLADELTPPLYPQHMALENLPVLGEKLAPGVEKLCARELLVRKGDKLGVRDIERLGALLNQLEIHNTALFPVVRHDNGKYMGTINMRYMLFAIRHARNYATKEEALKETVIPLYEAAQKQDLSWRDNINVTRMADELKIDRAFLARFVNLRSYVDIGATYAHEDTHARRLHALFRRLGVSHIPVVDRDHRLLGVLTRRNLLSPPGAASSSSHGHGHGDSHHAHSVESKSSEHSSASSSSAAADSAHGPAAAAGGEYHDDHYMANWTITPSLSREWAEQLALAQEKLKKQKAAAATPATELAAAAAAGPAASSSPPDSPTPVSSAAASSILAEMFAATPSAPAPVVRVSATPAPVVNVLPAAPRTPQLTPAAVVNPPSPGISPATAAAAAPATSVVNQPTTPVSAAYVGDVGSIPSVSLSSMSSAPKSTLHSLFVPPSADELDEGSDRDD